MNNATKIVLGTIVVAVVVALVLIATIPPA